MQTRLKTLVEGAFSSSDELIMRSERKVLDDKTV